MTAAAQGPEGADLLELLDRAIDARINARLEGLAETLAAGIVRRMGKGELTREDVAPGSRLLLTVTAAASALSLSRSTVYELIRRGEIESVKIGGTRRIRPDALEAFRARLADSEAHSATEPARAPTA